MKRTESLAVAVNFGWKIISTALFATPSISGMRLLISRTILSKRVCAREPAIGYLVAHGFGSSIELGKNNSLLWLGADGTSALPAPSCAILSNLNSRYRFWTISPMPKTFNDLVILMDRLRSPDGCPWDREQTYATLAPMLLEEAYEAFDALEEARQGRPKALREELGDLLFQITFFARVAKERGEFNIDDLIDEVHAKMVRRH